MDTLTPSVLVRFLKKHTTAQPGFERLKTIYRPYICPLHELLPLIQPKGASVFDVGCGGGVFLKLVGEFCSSSRLAGVDVDSVAVVKAQKLLSGWIGDLDIRLYDGVNLPESISQFDYVTMIDVLHHIPSAEKFNLLQSIFVKMKNGASLVLKDIDADLRFWLMFNKFHDLLLSGEAGSEISLNETREMLEEIGFHVEHLLQERMFCYAHFAFVALKPV